MTPRDRAHVVSSFTIVKGAMVEETYTVFRDWDFALTREDNLRRMMQTNSIGAGSDTWLRDVSKVLHRRFDPAGPDRPIVDLAKAGVRFDVWKPLLLWHITRDEFLVRDFLVNWLFPQFTDGALRLAATDLHPYLRALHTGGHVEAAWQPSTLGRVASGLLRLACDFDLLRGTQVREFAAYHLPEEAFIYLLHALAERSPNAHALIHAPDWRMYLLHPDDVERELFRLHQYRKLRYEVAGTLSQLDLPCPSAAAWAKEMAA